MSIKIRVKIAIFLVKEKLDHKISPDDQPVYKNYTFIVFQYYTLLPLSFFNITT